MLPPVSPRSCHLPPLHLMQKRLLSLSPDTVGFVTSRRISSGPRRRGNGQREPSRGNTRKLWGAFLAAASTTEGLLKSFSTFCCGKRFRAQIRFSQWLIQRFCEPHTERRSAALTRTPHRASANTASENGGCCSRAAGKRRREQTFGAHAAKSSARDHRGSRRSRWDRLGSQPALGKRLGTRCGSRAASRCDS